MCEILAPVVVFVYKRIDTLVQTIESLKQCELIGKTDLIVFSDGPKDLNDAKKVQLVRDYIIKLERSCFKSVVLNFSESNMGLANSVIGGVTKTLNEHNSVIVLEDDLVLSRNFLQYMNDCLVKYENNPKCFSVSGYSFNLKMPDDYLLDAYFTMRHCSWGWGIWKDRWNEIDWRVSDFDHFISSSVEKNRFDAIGSDLTSSLKKQQKGVINSWAIRANYHQFKKQTYTVYPVLSKLKNIGFNGEGTHTTQRYSKFDVLIDETSIGKFDLPEQVFVDERILKNYTQKFSLLTRLKFRLLNLFRF